MGKSQNLNMLFRFCLVLFGVVMLTQAYRPPYTQSRNCPANEYYVECGDPCQTKCRTLGKPCLIRNIKCPDGCYCIKDYARDDSGKCIPIEQCRY